MRSETIAVHAGGEPDPATGGVAPPIYLATTFEHGPASEPTHGHLYIRESNPLQSRLEGALAAIEGGETALVFASDVHDELVAHAEAPDRAVADVDQERLVRDGREREHAIDRGGEAHVLARPGGRSCSGHRTVPPTASTRRI